MGRFSPEKQHRRSIRLRGHDYTQIGAYFLTLCTWKRRCLLGEIREGQMRLNAAGKTVECCWLEVPSHFGKLGIDSFVVMPNHLHAIVHIVRATHGSPLQENRARGPASGSIGALIPTFKATTAMRINRLAGTSGSPVWQRNFYDRVIRSEWELTRIRRYIADNPARWMNDPENPDECP